MAEKGRYGFCVACRKETTYTLQKKLITKIIKEKKYQFSITTALCNECGEEINLPGLIDKNTREIDEQYRDYEGIVSIDDIEKLIKIYKLGKAPLSYALGFGEVTITRYLSGQIPSKEYSDIMKFALASPKFMKQKLRENRDKIADSAYSKAMESANQLENLFSVSDKMLRIIAYIFERLEEVTPLMLQKLLYFIQGVSFAVNDEEMFVEDCRAWAHGPVYPEVYDLFRDFKYNPIDDARFAIFENIEEGLSEKEIRIIDLVVNTFGEYGGKVLERITHAEAPWKDARKGYGPGISSNEPISKESIEKYYKIINESYDLSIEDGIRKYITAIDRLCY